MRVALYLRRSTDENNQPDSLDSQREILCRFAAANEYVIAREYPDNASGRSTRGRNSFLRLLNDVQRGEADFEAVLVRDVSRFGRFENIDESAYFEFVLLAHNVRVIYVEESFQQDRSPYSTLLKSLKRFLAAEYSRDRSRMIRFSQARVVEQGYVAGGPPPFGLKRAFFDKAGNQIQTAEPKEWKRVTSLRTKFVPGDLHQVAVVQRVFRMFVNEGKTRAQIAATLNREGVQTQQNKRWFVRTIEKILTNESYIGNAVYHLGGSFRNLTPAKRPPEYRGELVAVRRENSFQPIIERGLFDKAQEILRGIEEKRSQSRDDIADNVRRTVESAGLFEKRLFPSTREHVCAETIDRRFPGGYIEALTVAYHREIECAVAAFIQSLKSEFVIRPLSDKLSDGILLNDLLVLGFQFSWPRSRTGRVFYEFRFAGQETCDVMIGFGFGAAASDSLNVDSLFFFSTRLRQKKESVYVGITGGKRRAEFEIRNQEHLLKCLRREMYWHSAKSEIVLVRALQNRQSVSFKEVAAELGWPKLVVERRYKDLAASGVPLPPQRTKRGRKVVSVCPNCHRSRQMSTHQALLRRTDLCGKCYLRSVDRRVRVICPKCGKERLYREAAAGKLRNGSQSICLACYFSRGSRSDAGRKQSR